MAFLDTVKDRKSHFWKFEWRLGLAYHNEPLLPLHVFKLRQIGDHVKITTMLKLMLACSN